MMENKKTYIDNSRFMEFVSEMDTQLTELNHEDTFRAIQSDDGVDEQYSLQMMHKISTMKGMMR